MHILSELSYYWLRAHYGVIFVYIQAIQYMMYSYNEIYGHEISPVEIVAAYRWGKYNLINIPLLRIPNIRNRLRAEVRV